MICHRFRFRVGRLARPAINRHLRAFATRQTACGLHIDEDLPSNFKKILIANRGEIACRVMRTARELGVKTVAVYSDADAYSMHTSMADEAYCIGAPPAAQSYLLGQKIIDVAKMSGAQAIHPGYGFLSENAGFAKMCEDQGIEFIGPPASAIIAMGSKSASKDIMIAAGVPVVPGYHGDEQDPEFLKQEANRIGFPLMIKAVLGGGGKGMRIVMKPDEFDYMLQASKREAQASFGDQRVLLERYIVRPRHIEFQVFADKHGNAVHLLERDCSVQRRHQKVLEESPAPGMTPALRDQMGKSAVDAAKAVGYVGAGTVEFIFDAETDDYFFMEMNTRLQVEHPVTEMVVRKDLVQWQLHVAAGHKLPCEQKDIKVHGHALEARVYAENPYNNFLPATGLLSYLRTPQGMPGVRVETGVRENDQVSIFYDPMIAKLVVSAGDREQCLNKMLAALAEFQIVGPPNNISFLTAAVNHPVFRKGKVETGFIAQNMDKLLVPPTATQSAAICASMFLLLKERQHNATATAITEDPFSPWSTTSAVASAGAERRVRLITTSPSPDVEDGEIAMSVVGEPAACVVNVANQKVCVTAKLNGNERILCRIGDEFCNAAVVERGGCIHVFYNGRESQFKRPQAIYGAGKGGVGTGGVAPMAGKIVLVNVKGGDVVQEGTPLVIMEAMKMEHVIKAPRFGVVEAVFFGPGDFVDGGKLVVSFKAEAKE